jgi:hypothetical protein
MQTKPLLPKWQLRLQSELAYKDAYADLTLSEWRALLHERRLCSSNHDTVLALDFPHYCSDATEACGGANGWCYTFQGRQSSSAHHEKVMLVDQLAQQQADLFADTVAAEVSEAVSKGLIKYANIRVSGSGELTERHVPALLALSARGVHVWGFTKRLKVWAPLTAGGIELLFSVDSTTPRQVQDDAASLGARFSYTSTGVTDVPPDRTVVTFPLHRGGKVREVVDSGSLCPKVVEDFYYGNRMPGWCQARCQRCHLAKTAVANEI